MDEQRSEEFWASHCWSRRFNGEACALVATWRGPSVAEHSFTRAWRACDEHRMVTDEPLPPTITSVAEGP